VLQEKGESFSFGLDRQEGAEQKDRSLGHLQLGKDASCKRASSIVKCATEEQRGSYSKKFYDSFLSKSSTTPEK
jgi:hypothetical protein